MKSENPTDALKELDKCWNIALEIDSTTLRKLALFLKGITLVKQKSFDKAMNTADTLKALIEKGMNRKHWRYYYHLLGLANLEKGNFSDAIDNFNKALTYMSSQMSPLSLAEAHALFIEPLASAYYVSGDIDKALAEYEKITKLTSGRLYYGDIYAKSFYMIGKIYEEKDLKGKAIEHYEKFLSLWNFE